MLPNESPFPCGWPFSELAGYREPPEHSTYTYFPYDTLPPLPNDLFRGDYQWLASQPEYSNLQGWKGYAEDLRQAIPAKHSSLITEAERLGLSIPPSFFAFMGNADLICRIRSCTGCAFGLSQRIAPNPMGEGYFIHFLSDSQGCVYWNLFITQSGDHCVVASWPYFGDTWDETENYDDPNVFVFCASSFESFIYRFWLENEIWYQLSWHEKPLTDLQQRYVNHYHNDDA